MKLLYAHILLDRSGSMESCRDTTIDAFNEYVNGLNADPDLDAAVSLSLFDLDHTSNASNGVSLELVHDGVKSRDMPKLTRETFVPRGSTPLNDAIGRTVARMDAEYHRPGELIALVILTDGMENASREYSIDAVRKLLEDRRSKNWLVIFLGANIDAFHEGSIRGMSAANTMAFDTHNVKATMRSAARATGSYALTGSNADMSVGFTEAERAESKAPDPKDALKGHHHSRLRGTPQGTARP